MNGIRQGWLVAKREFRERSRSRLFIMSVIVMMMVVAAVLVLPGLLSGGGGASDVGVTGPTPAALPTTISRQAQAAGDHARIHRFSSLAAAERAVRQGSLDVLVVGGRRLEWTGRPDQALKSAVTTAIQQVAVRERAAAAGISPRALADLLAPVPVSSVELGPVAGRSPDDEMAVLVMTVVLFSCISIYGSMLLTGVLEEKSSRVVEVLLARMPARVLLAGKIAGIGLLGLAQVGATAIVAVIAATTAHSVQLPAVRGAVLAWAVIWFLLGYLLYATVYGALGSLGSRAEDAQNLAGPATIALVAAYFASFLMIARPASSMARALSFFPLTAPMAMPGRIAMGAVAWWEPVVAAVIALAAVAGLVWLAGRIYAGAILHGGPALSMRQAWRHRAQPGVGRRQEPLGGPVQPAPARRPHRLDRRMVTTVMTAAGLIIGGAVAALTGDVIMGVIAGAGFIAIAVQAINLWTRHSGPPAVPH
ncbi:MAG TPA: ABC transporter permease [Streptosporangiaceae bacterium]